MTYHDLLRKLDENPFKPFRVKLTNNTTYDIWEPWMITIGESSAIIVTETLPDEKGRKVARDWRTVSIAHMLEFKDLDKKEDHKRRSA